MKLCVFCFLMMAGAVLAKAPETSLRPVIRSGTQATGVVSATERVAETNEALVQGNGPKTSLRPKLRTRAVKRAIRKQQKLRAKGAVCGDPDIQGEVIGRVPGKISGCGVAQAVRIRSVSGVTLSQGSVMDCTTAQALNTWVDNSVKPALRNQGGGVQRLRIAAHYSCRTRNNKKGARISEHGKGRAIDVSGFQLRDGSRITVLKGWNAPETSVALRKMHKQACGPFGTVLGPNADRFHRDHFHFDTARYRNGTYCR